MARTRVGSPLGVALVAAVLVGLVTALVLSFVLEDDESSAPALTLAPTDESAPQVDIAGLDAPDFTIDALDGGDDIDFDELRDGRPAVVNFFGSWCAPCVQEMPDFEEAFQQNGDQVAFVGVSIQESVEDGQALVERTGVTYPTGRDANGEVLTEFHGTNMPTTIFVRADGTVLRSHTGRIHPDEIEAALEELTA
jgi:thiol-disulfide isomerase/thioredoxin